MNHVEQIHDLYETTYQTIRVNTEGVTHAESLVQPQPAGNCMNWIVGHVLSSRQGLIALLGDERVWSTELTARFKRSSAPVTGEADAYPFERMLDEFEESQRRLLRGIDRCTEARIDEPHERMGTIGKALYVLNFHEAYHSGQTGVLRRLIGKPGAIK